MDKAVLNVIHSRKSVRHYTEQAVSREALETLVRAGMSAPSAINRQPWVFIAIDERQILDELGSRLPYARLLLKTKAAIVVCGDMERAPDEWQQAFWIQDCSAAPVDEYNSARQFELLMKTMEEKGFLHYEISNYCRPGHFARHNTAYWQGTSYLGLGPSAHSYLSLIHI